MNRIACRDCGSIIESNSRGCQTCALNIEAERMIDRFATVIVAVILLIGISLILMKLFSR